MTVYT